MGYLLLILLILTGSGCSATTPGLTRVGASQPPEVSLAPVPWEADPAISTFAKQATNHQHTREDRVRSLVEAIYNKFEFSTSYDAHLTLTAQDVFRLGRGNCFSFTNLLVAASREVGIHAFYLDASRGRSTLHELEGQLVHSGHIVAGVVLDDLSVMVVDFAQLSRPEVLNYRAITDEDTYALFLNTLGWDIYRQGGDALPWFQAATRISPMMESPWNNLAALLIQQGQIADAELILRQATRGRSQSFAPWYNLGLIYLKQGDYVRAEDAFEHAYIRKHDSAVVVYQLGLAYQYQGKGTRAGWAFHRARHLGHPRREGG